MVARRRDACVRVGEGSPSERAQQKRDARKRGVDKHIVSDQADPAKGAVHERAKKDIERGRV